MIGLGSNRMTVCRRGGMRVTQAGRGGMEWLAGGRGPSWASPYSAQATAALKAQFPTQWPTIRDYGFAHPEIVGYMNAYAPEDAKIAYSLVEGIGTRWLKNATTAYIDLPATINQDISLEAYGIMDAESYDQASVFSTGTNNSNGLHIWVQGGVYGRNGRYTYGSQSYASMPNMTVGSPFRVKTEKNHFATYLADGTIWGEKTFNYTAFTYSTKLRLFGLNYNGTLYNGCSLLGGLSMAKVWSGDTLSFYLIPFKRNGAMGMIDLLTGTFYGNANSSGSFTESIETPAS